MRLQISKFRLQDWISDWRDDVSTAAASLSPYEILSAIGAGGMGEMFSGRDTKLNRDVALKILPDAFASDADRLARFTREAQTVASLNHSNIGAI
jgi:serine/threonine protein kinase